MAVLEATPERSDEESVGESSFANSDESLDASPAVRPVSSLALW